jgi:Ca2+-transporting ATPase
MAGEALPVLGIAYKVAAPEQEPFADLVWLGLAGMMDPLRPGMDRLLHRFHIAGIKTAMITGDQSATAYAIARQLNLADGQSIEILDSNNLETIDSDLLSGVVQRVQVFARVSPAHKLQIVQALQQAKQIVAMTGDGINDGPALKAADMGVAMGGGTNTEIAQSLADIVLADDNLETMEVAVSHGRTIYANVRKGIRFLISTNLSEIEVMLAGIGLGLGQPLNPMQLLWINLITDIFPGLALAMEAPEADVMQRPPRDPQEPVIARRDLRRLGWESAVISAGTLASYGYAFWRYGEGPQARTQAFMTLTLGQLLHALSSRSEQHTLLERHQLPPNPHLNAALGISLAAQLLTVLVPGLRNILGTTLPTLTDGLVMGAGALAPLLVNEITKTRRSAKPAAVSPSTQDHTPLAKDVAL